MWCSRRMPGGFSPVLRDHGEVPQVVIPGTQLSDALNRPQREVAIAHPGRCVAPLKGLPTGSIERLLDEAAVYRASIKASRWLRTADAHGRDAALFQSTAETLGYRGNALAMRLLSQRTPLSLLKSEGDAAEAILFGTAGFLLRIFTSRHRRIPATTFARCGTPGGKTVPVMNRPAGGRFLGKPTGSVRRIIHTGGWGRLPHW